VRGWAGSEPAVSLSRPQQSVQLPGSAVLERVVALAVRELRAQEAAVEVHLHVAAVGPHRLRVGNQRAAVRRATTQGTGVNGAPQTQGLQAWHLSGTRC
jgi:hypothetical protein